MTESYTEEEYDKHSIQTETVPEILLNPNRREKSQRVSLIYCHESFEQGLFR